MTRLAALIAGAVLVPFFATAQMSPADILLGLLINPQQMTEPVSSTAPTSATTTDANDPRVAGLFAQVLMLKDMLDRLVLARNATSSLATSTQTVSPSEVKPEGATSRVLTRNLKRGNRGEDVRALQTFLIAQGFLDADLATGYFGALTEKAVQALQTREKIVSSGTPLSTGFGAVGPKTRASINRALASSSAPDWLLPPFATATSTATSTLSVLFTASTTTPNWLLAALAATSTSTSTASALITDTLAPLQIISVSDPLSPESPPQCPIIASPADMTCNGVPRYEQKDEHGCTVEWLCVTSP